MLTASLHSILARAALAALLSAAGTSVAALSSQIEGCLLLRDQASVICKAKVSCSASAAAIEAIRPQFERCAAGERIPRRDVEAAIAAFRNPRTFRCCIGNDLVPMLPSAFPYE